MRKIVVSHLKIQSEIIHGRGGVQKIECCPKDDRIIGDSIFSFWFNNHHGHQYTWDEPTNGGKISSKGFSCFQTHDDDRGLCIQEYGTRTVQREESDSDDSR